jgi:hypothetical protein
VVLQRGNLDMNKGVLCCHSDESKQASSYGDSGC